MFGLMFSADLRVFVADLSASLLSFYSYELLQLIEAWLPQLHRFPLRDSRERLFSGYCRFDHPRREP